MPRSQSQGEDPLAEVREFHPLYGFDQGHAKTPESCSARWVSRATQAGARAQQLGHAELLGGSGAARPEDVGSLLVSGPLQDRAQALEAREFKSRRRARGGQRCATTLHELYAREDLNSESTLGGDATR